MMTSTHLPRTLAAMQLMDSALPTGAFSHSFGFETYLHRGVIHDAASFGIWLRMFIQQQLTFTDAVVIRELFQSTSLEHVGEMDQLITAQAVPNQIRTAGQTMGIRMLEIAEQAYPGPALIWYRREVNNRTLTGHPAIVWALVARDLGFTGDEAVAHHLYATTMSLIHNAVRAVPLGQNAGQQLIREAQEWVTAAVETSAVLEPGDIGSITPGLEIAQIQHESQRARMFMS